MIQHLNNVQTMFDLLDNDLFVKDHMLYVLFQIYATLACMGTGFTHYDLHTDNVLMYIPVDGKYITYHYHLSGTEEVIFNSPFMAKIIDYGRCYMEHLSESIHEKVCNKPECGITLNEDKCGVKVGYKWLNNNNMRINCFNFP
jgi:hypothetical protein